MKKFARKLPALTCLTFAKCVKSRIEVFVEVELSACFVKEKCVLWCADGHIKSSVCWSVPMGLSKAGQKHAEI